MVRPDDLQAVLMAVLFLAARGGARVLPPALECRLKVDAHVASGLPVNARFTLRNPGRQPISVLTWNTPLEGLLSDTFRITRVDTGEILKYTGPQVKRGDPEGDDYLGLAASAAVSESVDLTQAYDLSRPGEYTVAFAGRLHDVAAPAAAPRPRRRHRAVTVGCAPATLTILPPGPRPKGD